MKIAVYAIAKNEEQFVERFMNFCKDADCVIVGDTGSTDDTVNELRKLGATVHDICISPFRFDNARNAVLAMIPRDVDVCISLDMDEILEPGWRAEVERLFEPGITRLRYLFDYGYGIVFKHEKIHARHGYQWHHPCHERPEPYGIEEVWAETDMMLSRHLPDPAKSRGQYLELLELSVKEDPSCDRNAFYYARELSFYGRREEALVAFQRYLDMPSARWNLERSYAHRLMGDCYKALGRVPEASKAYHLAMLEAPDTREPWVALAHLAYETSDWQASAFYAEKALEIRVPMMVYMRDPSAWGARPSDLAAIAHWNLGNLSDAWFHAQFAASLEPDDERLKSNLALIESELELQEGGK